MNNDHHLFPAYRAIGAAHCHVSRYRISVGRTRMVGNIRIFLETNYETRLKRNLSTYYDNVQSGVAGCEKEQQATVL